MLYYEMMLHGDDGVLNAHVTVLRNPRFDNVVDRVFGAAESRVAMETLRAIPTNMALVMAFYPKLNSRQILNSKPSGGSMDLSDMFETKKAPAADLPVRLLAPLPNVMPDDPSIKYCQVIDIASVQASPPQSVLLFAESDYELLEVIVDHPVLFGFNGMVLSGLPTANYDAQFESRTYTLERVAHATFVNEVIEYARVEAALKDENATSYERERAQYTKANGSVKPHTRHRSVGAADAVEPDDDVEA